MIYAILAAITWGFDYAIAEKVFEKVPVQLYLFYQTIFNAIVLGLFLILTKHNVILNTKVFLQNKNFLIYFIAGLVLFSIGNILIFLGIKESNATVAGLIEISYPIFIIIASYFLFKTNHLNLYTIIGGLLIISGVIIIYLKN